MAHLTPVLTAVTLVNHISDVLVPCTLVNHTLDVLVPWMTTGATTQQQFPLLYKQERRSVSLLAPYPNPLVKIFAPCQIVDDIKGNALLEPSVR